MPDKIIWHNITLLITELEEFKCDNCQLRDRGTCYVRGAIVICQTCAIRLTVRQEVDKRAFASARKAVETKRRIYKSWPGSGTKGELK